METPLRRLVCRQLTSRSKQVEEARAYVQGYDLKARALSAESFQLPDCGGENVAARAKIWLLIALGAAFAFAFIIWPEISIGPAPGAPALQCYSGGICGP